MEYYDYYYGDYLVQFEKDVTDKDKYIVFCCAKNEDKYLKEWIDYYLDLGFDKIIIADNNDEPTLNVLLSEYLENGTVQLFNCMNMINFQVDIYDMFLKTKNYRWCAFFDCDEFLVLNNGDDNIKVFLDRMDNDCIFVNWLNMSNNGDLVNDGRNVCERFDTPFLPIDYCKENMYGKVIIKNSDINFSFSYNVHKPLVDADYKISYGGYYDDYTNNNMYGYPLRYKMCYLKHFYTKSFEEYKAKKERGYPDGTPLKINYDTFNYFNKRTVEFEKDYLSSTLNIDTFECVKEGAEPYDFIFLRVDKVNYFSIYYNVLYILLNKENIALYIDYELPDELFNRLLSYAFFKHNRLFSKSDKDNLSNIMNKYSARQNNYYYIALSK